MDENLINQCRKMERTSQRRMYELLAPKLYLVCKRYLKQETDIEEALADAFYTIFTKLEQLKENAAFEVWAKRIVINECLLTIRRKKERQLYVEDVAETSFVKEKNDNPLDEQDVLKLLDYLPQGAKTVFCLYAIEGYSHKEIAKQLNVSEGTTKSQLNVARTKLKELIELFYNQTPESYGKSR